jgi:hypothetical protein
MTRFGVLGAAALLWLALAPAGWADTISERPDRVSVTIYRGGGDTDSAEVADPDGDPSEGLGLIREERTIDIPAGRSRISFRGVASGIVPQTAAIEGLPGVMIERNQDYDLLTPGALIAKSMGQTITLTHTNPTTGAETSERAVVRSGPDGVMLDFGDRLEALSCSGLPERIAFDSLPAGLTSSPTLSVVVDAPQAGRYRVTLTYLAVGLLWSADYVARIAPDGATLALTGWITLANRTDTGFDLAPTEVVAGQLAMDEDTRPIDVEAIRLYQNCWPLPWNGWRPSPPAPPAPPPVYAPIAVSGFADSSDVEAVIVTGSRIARQSELGDYKLYSLPENTTISAHQTKQVMMLDEPSVRFRRVYRVAFDEADISDDPDSDDFRVEALLRFDNNLKDGLGKPLPAGVVSVLEPGQRGPVLIGEKQLRDVPVGEPIEIALGGANDVSVRPVGVDFKYVRGGWAKGRFELALANNKPFAITLEVTVRDEYHEGFQILGESSRHVLKDGRIVWSFPLQPGERAKLSYSARWK